MQLLVKMMTVTIFRNIIMKIQYGIIYFMERMFSETSSKKVESSIDTKIAGVVLAGILSAFPSENVEAMEMPPRATWSQGIEAAHESVMKGEVEHGFVFLKYPGVNDKSFWPTIIKGSEYSVQLDASAIAGAVSKEMNSGKIEKICFGHSHPMWEKFAYQFPKGDLRWKTLPNPPSVEDIKAMHKTVQTTSKIGVSQEDLTFFVVDPRGVWYFSPSKNANSAEVIQEFVNNDVPEASQKKFSDYSRLFQENLNPETDIRQTPSYNERLNNYEQLLGASLRFVPLNEVASEPPCAGVDLQNRGQRQ